MREVHMGWIIKVYALNWCSIVLYWWYISYAQKVCLRSNRNSRIGWILDYDINLLFDGDTFLDTLPSGSDVFSGCQVIVTYSQLIHLLGDYSSEYVIVVHDLSQLQRTITLNRILCKLLVRKTYFILVLICLVAQHTNWTCDTVKVRPENETSL